MTRALTSFMMQWLNMLSVFSAVTHGLSEKVSACCGLTAYNTLNEICCKSTIIAKSGPKAKCCDEGECTRLEFMCKVSIASMKFLILIVKCLLGVSEGEQMLKGSSSEATQADTNMFNLLGLS